jgi:acyl carrier protein
MNPQDKILAIIRKVAHKEVSPAPDESLFDSGILDSFALPDMVGELEKEFRIQVPDSDLNPRSRIISPWRFCEHSARICRRGLSPTARSPNG